MLGANPESHSARDEQFRLRRCVHQTCNRPRRVQDLLEVVEDDQHPTPGKRRCDPVDRIAPRLGLDSTCGSNGGNHPRRVAQCRKVHEPDAINSRLDRASHLNREPRLSRSTSTRKGEQ